MSFAISGVGDERGGPFQPTLEAVSINAAPRAQAERAVGREKRKMAMTMNGEYQLAVSRETVWEKLNDTETLKACIPGCEQLDKLSDTEMQAVATVKIGPVKAKFKGKVTLSDLDPPNGYKISGQGDGGVAGFAKGGATVKLTPKDGGTLLSYASRRRSAASSPSSASAWSMASAKKVADDFFEIRQGGQSGERDVSSRSRVFGSSIVVWTAQAAFVCNGLIARQTPLTAAKPRFRVILFRRCENRQIGRIRPWNSHRPPAGR